MSAKTFLAQLQVQIKTELDAVPAGFIGLAPKSDGFYVRKNGEPSKRLLTESDISAGWIIKRFASTSHTIAPGKSFIIMPVGTITYNHSIDANGDVTALIGSGMGWPGAGIAVSTGTEWGTSLPNNSGNWNNAVSWGNHSLAGYATATWVGQQGFVTGTPWTGMGYITNSALTGYATTTWVGQQGFVTGTPWTGMGYVTGTPWTGLGYITNSALTGYATTTWVGQQGFVTGTPWTGMGYITSSALTGYATTTWVGQQGFVTGTPWTGMGYITGQTSHADVVVDGDFAADGILRRGSSSGAYTVLKIIPLTLTAASTVYWDINNGVNAYMNLNVSGVWLELQNLSTANKGLSGNLVIQNGSGSPRNLTFGGASSIAVAPNIQYQTDPAQYGDRVLVSGNYANDLFSWYWDGSILWINGTLAYT